MCRTGTSPYMRPEKIFRLGRVRVDGDLIEFQPAESLHFDAERRDQVSVGVAFDYKEASDEKEQTRIRLTAHIEGQAPSTFEAVIGDSPLLDDSRRGFVSVPVRVSHRGAVKGRFVVETSYASGPWKMAELPTAAREQAEGEFVIRVT